MTDYIWTDICVIGGGSGGLSLAAGASQLGANVVLIEEKRLGGDCLNSGCIPSKALLAAAHSRDDITNAARFGIYAKPYKTQMQDVHTHIQDVIAGIAPHDSTERFTGLGVRVIIGKASFVGFNEVAVSNFLIKARRFAIATGSSPKIPAIPGIKSIPYFTNETIFDNKVLPDHLAILGGGFIGTEIAQAYTRLGSKVTLIEKNKMLSAEDPELTEMIRNRLKLDGVTILEETSVHGLSNAHSPEPAIEIKLQNKRLRQTLVVSHLAIATGRQINTQHLNLEAAGVKTGKNTILVDRRLRTSNRRIFALGDVIGSNQFTHAANHEAIVVLRNILFRLPARTKTFSIPRVIYTDPEFAHIGMTEEQARTKKDEIVILRSPFSDNDRARADRATEGFIKVITTRRGKILGVSIVGRSAGELLQPWTLAIENGLKVSKLAQTIAAYPTRGEVSKRVASSFFAPKLFNQKIRRIVRFMLAFS